MSIDPISNGDGGAGIRAKINAAIEVANTAVVGPDSATAGRFPRFTGGTGRLVEDGGPLVADDITNASAAGKAVLTAADAAAQQTALGGTTVGKAVFTAADAAAGRTALATPYYEEGTFTPTYSATITPPTGVAYSVQTGRYTRTGRKWLFEGRMIVSNVGTGGAGVAFMGGLPVAAGLISFTTCLRSTGATIPSGGVIAGLLDSYRMYLQYQTNGGPVDLSWADIPSSFDVIFSFQITT